MFGSASIVWGQWGGGQRENAIEQLYQEQGEDGSQNALQFIDVVVPLLA